MKHSVKNIVWFLCFALPLTSMAQSPLKFLKGAFSSSAERLGRQPFGGQPLSQEMVAKIISEPEENLQHNLLLNLGDNGDILQLIRQSKNDQQVFTIQDLSDKEVVLAKAEGRDAVLLSCENCHASYGGYFELKYLYNGAVNKYKTLPMELHREGESWALYTAQAPKVRINSLHLRSNLVFGRLIGIRSVDVNTKSRTGRFGFGIR